MLKFVNWLLVFTFLVPIQSYSSSRELLPEEQANIDIMALSNAVNIYYREFGRYPTNEEGIDILSQELWVNKSCPCKKEKLLAQVPLDPWGRDYLYLSPGKNNPNSFDIWTNGKNGQPDGDGENRGCGNWGELKCGFKKQHNVLEIVLIVFAFGFGIGILPYAVGVCLKYKTSNSLKKSLFGYHFGVFVYLILAVFIAALIPEFL